jgi:hypothetical protein
LLIYIKVLGAVMLTVTNILDLHEVVQVILADVTALVTRVGNRLAQGRQVLVHQVALLILVRTDQVM